MPAVIPKLLFPETSEPVGEWLVHRRTQEIKFETCTPANGEAEIPPTHSDALRLSLLLESVRRLQAGLHSFLSMRRIEARRKNASAFRLRFSQSLASLRQRLSQAMVRSTIQRFGKTTNPLT